MLKTVPPMTDDEVSRCTPPQEAGFGSLTSERGPLPLKAMDVQVRIDGLVAQITLEQTFVNVHAVPLEATYIFPLPDRAAVTRFRLEVAGRVIEGQLKERGAARREYQQAIEQGHRAGIAEEERPGVFTLRVGNLPPGETARVQLSLTGPLPYSDGEATFRFPLVVAPRYIPGTPLPGPSVGDGTAADTDAVPDASRISPPVLLPGFPNPVRLSLRVDFSPSWQPHDLRSSLHTVIEEAAFPSRRVLLQPGERLNRDFILRFRLAEDRIRTGLSLQPDAEGNEGTFLLTLVPPASPHRQVGELARPRDVVFVLDRSGSMEGWKIVAARRALARMVDTLTERDRFTVIAFDSGFELPGEFAGQLVSGEDRHRFQAVEFLARIQAQGGTEMAESLARAVDLLHGDKTSGRERILVLVTDGQVGNEDQILQHLGVKAKKVRIFTLGIDRAVNAAFLRRLSDLGGGASELVESEERLEEVMTHVHRMIGTPLLTSLKLEPAGLKVIPGSVVPGLLSDLFAGAPLLVMGRYQGQPQGGLALQGRDSSGGAWQSQLQASGETSPAIASVWARGRLRELEDRYSIDHANRPALEKEIVSLSLRFGVLCRFTSFVAVDRAEVVNAGGTVQGIVQPVEQPEGWSLGMPACLAMLSPAPASSGEIELEVEALEEEGSLDLDICVEDSVSPECSYGSQDIILEDLGEVASTRARRMLAEIGLGESKADKEQPAQPSREESDPRTSAQNLLQALRGCPTTDPEHRLSLLRQWKDRLEELYRALVSTGAQHLATEHLGLAVASLQRLLDHSQLAEVHAVWTELETSLDEYLNGPAKPQGREGFWK